MSDASGQSVNSIFQPESVQISACISQGCKKDKETRRIDKGKKGIKEKRKGGTKKSKTHKRKKGLRNLSGL